MGRHPPSIAKSPTTLRPQAGERGFTLIEVVVVLFIMATVAGFALLALGDAGRGDKLKAEATRLHDAMQLASEEAQMRGSAIGASIAPEDYRFSVRVDNHWRPLDQDSILRTHRLAAGMRLSLEKPAPAASQSNGSRQPDVVFYTSGESTPFAIGLADSDGTGRYKVSGNGYGEFSVNPQAAQP